MQEEKYTLNVEVDKDNVKITNKEKIHKGEYKVTKCVFNFSEDFDNLTKKAIFEAEDIVKEMPIIDNKCDIPTEILLSDYITCNLRVYAYDIEEIEGEYEFKIRYSPAYDEFPLWRGSYMPGAEEGEEITPSQFEQYTNALNQGLEAIDNKIEEVDSKIEIIDGKLEDIDIAITETNNLDLEVNKVDTTTTIEITKKDGTKKSVEVLDGLPGQDGKDGEDGVDGYTPVKGVDYYTEEEIQEIVNEITEKSERDVYRANMVYNALPKVTGTGEEITLNNTAETPIKLELKPSELSQETTTGKNLLNNTLTSASIWTINSDKTITLNGTVSIPEQPRNIYINENASLVNDTTKTYTFSIGVKNENIGMSIFEYINGNWVNKKYQANTESITYTPSGNQTGQMFRIFVYASTFNNITIFPMLVEGTTVGEYEPYTNGASPNPDYPQEIHTITGDNTITISNSDNTQSQTYSIPLGNLEYCKIGDYSDRIFKNVVGDPDYDSSRELGKWYIKKNFGKYETSGNESIVREDTQGGNYRFDIMVNVNFKPTSTNYPVAAALCNRLISKSATETFLEQQGFRFYRYSDNIYIQAYIEATKQMTTTEFKTWLSTNNLIVVGALSTPTYELLSNTLQDLLNALENAISYKDQTNISQTNDDLPITMNAEAVRDISNI